jgi:hypothetical protein
MMPELRLSGGSKALSLRRETFASNALQEPEKWKFRT